MNEARRMPWTAALGAVLVGALIAARFAPAGLAAASLRELAAVGARAVDRLTVHPDPWYLSRAAGLLSYALLWFSVASGLLLSTRLGQVAWVPALLTAAHNLGAAIGLYAALFHALILRYDQYLPFPWVAIVVPFAGRWKPFWVGLGGLAFYAAVLVTVSTYLRKSIGAPAWRLLHRLSFVAYAALLAHAVALGTDTRLPWVQGLYWSTGTLAVALTAYRMSARPARPGGRGGPAERTGAALADVASR